MNLNRFIRKISTQTSFLFQERRCVLCHLPFHPAQHTISPFENLFQTFSATTFSNNNNNNNNNNKLLLERATSHGNTHVSNEEQKIRFLQQVTPLATLHVQKNLCPDCAKELNIQTNGFCPTCGDLFSDAQLTQTQCAKCIQENPPWDTFTFLGVYKTCLRELLLKAKFGNSTSSLSFLGKLFAYFWFIHIHSQSIKNNNQIQFPNVIIPMPLHHKRLKERGYNQCNELTKYFFKELSHILVKFKIEKPKITIDYENLM